MNRENDLLPWIMGGLLAASAAVAVAVVTHRDAPHNLPSPPQAAASTQAVTAAPAAASASLPSPAAEPAAPAPAPEPSQALEPVQPAGAPIASGSQIWECTTNGQKTFSDKRCGSNAVLRETNTMNIMNPSPILPPARPYPPQSGGEPDYYYPDAQEPGDVDSSYPVVIGYPYIAHRRPERAHRPYRSHSTPIARRN